MYCPDEGPAVGSVTREGVKLLSFSPQVCDTREQEDKDVRTSNYTPGTCEIGALKMLVKNNAPRWRSQAPWEGRVQSWEWGVEEEVFCSSSCWWDPVGLLARDSQRMHTVLYLLKPRLHFNLMCVSKSTFKLSLKPLLLKILPVWSSQPVVLQPIGKLLSCKERNEHLLVSLKFWRPVLSSQLCHRQDQGQTHRHLSS